MDVLISVLIRTKNESDNIEALLQKIHSQKEVEFEIIVVDSESSDGTPDIAKRYTNNIFTIPQTDFTYGYSLNYGISKSSGQFIAIISGDALPNSDYWLKELLAPFKNKLIGGVCGKQMPGTNAHVSVLNDYQTTYPDFSRIQSVVPFFSNANSMIRKDLWEQTSFDETMIASEDVAWVKSVQSKGYLIYYNPLASVIHPPKEPLRVVKKRSFRETKSMLSIDVAPSIKIDSYFLVFLKLGKLFLKDMTFIIQKRLGLFSVFDSFFYRLFWLFGEYDANQK